MFWPHTEEKNAIFTGIRFEPEAERTVCHAYGLLSALVGLVIIHAACFTHYRPLLYLAFSAESFKVLFLLSETFIFGSIASDQRLIFPVVTGLVTLLSTLVLLYLTAEDLSDIDENTDLMRKSRKLKKK